MDPTEIGLAYYDRAQRVLNDAGEADALVASMQVQPSGILRVAALSDFGACHLSPVLGDFLAHYPEVTVYMQLSPERIDPVAGGFDLVLRLGEPEDSSLRVRKLAETTTRMIAAPSYLERAGRPQRIDDVRDHKLLHYSQSATGNVWRLTSPSGEVRQIRSPGFLMVNDGRSLLSAAIAGLGIAYLPDFLYAPALAAGQVVEVMPELPGEVQSLHVLYPPGRFTQPKVRAFIDFLVETFGSRGPGGW